jgi:hypothetical protein
MDVVACGRGQDWVDSPRWDDLVAPECERFELYFGRYGEDQFDMAAYPRPSTRDATVFRMTCPRLEEWDGEPTSCRGRLVLREAFGEHRVLGSGRIRNDGLDRNFAVPIRLTPLGHRIGRKDGVWATARLRGTRIPSVSWTIRLRVQ